MEVNFYKQYNRTLQVQALEIGMQEGSRVPSQFIKSKFAECQCNNNNSLVWQIMIRIGIPSIKEQNGLTMSHGK
jgi:hypothetical protein